MDGLFFLMSIVGVGLVMWWMVTNDRIAADKPTTGLFAMVETAGRRKRAQRKAAGLAPDPLETKPTRRQ